MEILSGNRKAELKEGVMRGMYETGQILTWYRDRPEGWKLASGLWSPFYINQRSMPSHPKVFQDAVTAVGSILLDLGYKPYSKDKVVGLAMAGIPIASALSAQFGFPSLYTRKLPDNVKTEKDVEEYVGNHGQHALVEGTIENGDRLIMIDDLVTKFDSKLLAMGQINGELKKRNISATVKDIAVLIDREQGGETRAAELGMGLHSFIRFKSEGIGLLKESLSEIEYSTITDYLSDDSKYQEKGLQNELQELARRKGR